MTGTVNKISINKLNGFEQTFTFIKCNDGKDYFLHKSDFVGDWIELVKAVKEGAVQVQFDITSSDKGPRACNCMVI